MSRDRAVWNSAFRTCLFDTLKPIGCFSDEELGEMCSIAFKHGLDAKGQYYKDIYEKFFADRAWFWPEQVEWEKRFEEANKWPESLLWRKGKIRSNLQQFQDIMGYIDDKSAVVADCVGYVRLGISSVALVFSSEMGENDKFWITSQLEKSPESLPPFFPNDKTMIRAVIGAYEKRRGGQDCIIVQLPSPQKTQTRPACKSESWLKRGLKFLFGRKA